MCIEIKKKKKNTPVGSEKTPRIWGGLFYTETVQVFHFVGFAQAVFSYWQILVER